MWIILVNHTHFVIPLPFISLLTTMIFGLPLIYFLIFVFCFPFCLSFSLSCFLPLVRIAALFFFNFFRLTYKSAGAIRDKMLRAVQHKTRRLAAIRRCHRSDVGNRRRFGYNRENTRERQLFDSMAEIVSSVPRCPRSDWQRREIVGARRHWRYRSIRS